MKAMVLTKVCNLNQNKEPLTFVELPQPEPKENEILIKVAACGVCHTELDEIEGRTPPSFFPIVPGHQIVGNIVKLSKTAARFKIGDRVGIAWINSCCGICEFCLSDKENLCPDFKATGRDVNGGYAEYISIREDFAYRIPDIFSDTEAAPLLCAGAIGYRSLKLTGIVDGQNLGLTGFGASAHLVIKIAKHLYPNSKIFVFARSKKERNFAKELGAYWSGDIDSQSTSKLHCIIDTTPVWKPIISSLKNLTANGRLVINAIRKEEIDKSSLLSLDYPSCLWLEKEIKSVANVTRNDVSNFLKLASEIHIKPEVQEYPLKEANTALIELKERKIRGAKVLKII
ncbi:MAG: zinc-dependent alcohol dehydrogenase family protein [Candidatus Hydrogenedentota bacterium]